MTAASAGLRRYTASSALLLFALLLALPGLARGDEIDVRLLVHRSPAEIVLRAPGWTLVDGAGQSADADGCRLTMRGAERGAVCGDTRLTQPPLALQPKRLDPTPVILKFDGRERRYPGRLRFEVRGDKLVPLLRLDLEEYVAGVILAESNDDHPTLLQVLAICARSYAVYRLERTRAPLHDDTRSQMFRGISEGSRTSTPFSVPYR